LLACDNGVAPAALAHDASVASSSDAALLGDASNDADDAGSDDVADDAWGPDPPSTACVQDDAATCLPTPNQCADSRWLVTYFNGSCAAGQCRFSKRDIDCVKLGGGTCGPPTDAGQGDAQVQFIHVLGQSGSGCILPAPPGPDAPATACDEDAGTDAAPCSPPPSVCADSQWLVYFDNGQCVTEQCAWQKVRQYCGNGCTNGACSSRPTVPLPP
jgi:hypothetical protein